MFRRFLSRSTAHALLSLFLALTFAGRHLAAQSAGQKVDTLFRAFTAKTPGCAVGVLQNGKVVLAKGYGAADLEHDLPLTAQSFFFLLASSLLFFFALLFFFLLASLFFLRFLPVSFLLLFLSFESLSLSFTSFLA